MTSIAPWTIDCNFPGGNIIVERIEGDTAWLRQDLRGTQKWWFYWSFRVMNAGGRFLTFNFTLRTDSTGVGVCASTDGGLSWFWTGPQVLLPNNQPGFRFHVPKGANEVRFAISFPYLQANLDRFLSSVPNSITKSELCRSRHGRSVELLRCGNPDARRKLYLCSRHHACESTGTWTIEGILREITSNSPCGKWFQNEVDVMIVPFVDKDGVEEGDPGKNRTPHDHNRDYNLCIYPEISAIKKLLPSWIKDAQAVTLDFHCPMLYTTSAFLVKVGSLANMAKELEFVEILQNQTTTPAAILDENHADWTKPNEYADGIHSTRWMASLPEVILSASIETSYCRIADAIVTPELLLKYGGDIARSIKEFFLKNTNNI